jgi:nucleoside-diphosphate-sugar epimerase
VYSVSALAEAGHEVCSIDRKSFGEHPRGTRQIIVDLTDAGEVYDALARFRPDAVCHIGAIPDPTRFSSQSTFRNNVISSFNVFQAAGDFGVKRLAYASSEMATGWLTTEQLPPQFPFNEADRTDSPSAYALSKYMGEIIADSMVQRYPELSVVSLRINNVIMPDWYDRLQRRRDNFMQEGDANFWSYIDVRDVATAFVAALRENRLDGQAVAGHEVFLIAAADNCLDMPLPDAVEQRYGSKGNFAAGFDPGQSAFDCGKIKEWFGWQPQHSWRDL